MSKERPSWLARWAERKSGAEAPVETPALTLTEDEIAARLAALPKLDDIDALTDIRPFLQRWVPMALRNAALRKVWASDPHIAHFVGMADYQWDWNSPEGVPGFGPIDTSFDHEAFLRQLFASEAPAKPAPPPAASADIAASQREPSQLPPLGSRPEQGAAENCDDESATSRGNVNKVENETAATQQNSTQPNRYVTQRHRRHGGALPRPNVDPG